MRKVRCIKILCSFIETANSCSKSLNSNHFRLNKAFLANVVKTPYLPSR